MPAPASKVSADLKNDPSLIAFIQDYFKVKLSFISAKKIELEGDKDSLTAARECIREKLNDSKKKHIVRTHQIKGNQKAN